MSVCLESACEEYLAGSLSAVEERSFVAHLDACGECRNRLQALSGGDAFADSAREVLLATGEDPRSGLQSLEAQEASERRTESAVAATALSFLAPTDDPAMMGRLGPYEVLGVLGRGGMGIVLKGYDRALGRNVALKVLDPAAAGIGAARERFAREARAMAAVSHEHVVPVYGVEEHSGLPYFVMEFVAGGTLERRLATQGACDVLSVVRVALQAARALSAAHGQGLVHRDIKPGNILLDRGTERIRVADFGLARVANEVSCTHSGFTVGTPQFMAPEQVRGETCDARSDLFSLGAVMYAMCTGHAPFRAETVYGVMQRIVHEAPRSIREQNPQIPEWLEQLILRLLAKSRDERFASADEVAAILQDELAYLQNPTGLTEPRRDWRPPAAAITPVPRRRWRRAVGGTALVALLLTAAVLWWPDAPARRDNDGWKTAVGRARAEGRLGLEGASASLAGGLWSADGVAETRGEVAALGEAWRRGTPAGPDLWNPEVSEIVRGLSELARPQPDDPDIWSARAAWLDAQLRELTATESTGADHWQARIEWLQRVCDELSAELDVPSVPGEAVPFPVSQDGGSR